MFDAYGTNRLTIKTLKPRKPPQIQHPTRQIFRYPVARVIQIFHPAVGNHIVDVQQIENIQADP